MSAEELLGLKKYISNISIDDEKFLEIIQDVFKNICFETKIFKKLYGFTILKGVEIYDFQFIANINEKNDENITDLIVGEPTKEQILDFTNNVEFENYIDFDISTNEIDDYINIIDIRCICDDKFNPSNDFVKLDDVTFAYKYEINNEKFYIFKASIMPSIYTIDNKQFDIIKNAIIEGTKYYILDDISNGQDAQVSNLYYQRFFNEKRKIIDASEQFSYNNIKRGNLLSHL